MTFSTVRKLFVVCVLLFLSATFSVSAQEKRLKAIRVHGGSFHDSYQNLTPEGLLSMIKGGTSNGFNLSDYEEYAKYASLEGGNIGIDFILTPQKPLLKGNIMQEIRVGVSANIEREAMIDMQKKHIATDSYYDYETVGLCIIENEFILQGAYLLHLGLIEDRLTVFGGLGGNAGTTFNNRFIFVNLNDEFIAARNSQFFRGYGLLGASYRMGRVKLDLESIYGAGWQIVNGADNNIMNRTRGVQFGISYLLDR